MAQPHSSTSAKFRNDDDLGVGSSNDNLNSLMGTKNAGDGTLPQGSFSSVPQQSHDSGIGVTSQRPCAKKVRYSQSYGHSSHTTRFSALGSFLGFEEFNSTLLSNTPTPVRTTLDLDSRFFPSGLEAGHVVEVKGPENSGKTFLLTYFLAQLLTRYTYKTAVLIDTSHQFNLKNLVSIILHADPATECHSQDSSPTLSQILEKNPKLTNYLDRLFIIKCNTVEDFLMTIGPKNNSMIERMIQKDPNLSLIAIDTVDNYSFAGSITTKDANSFPNILSLITRAVRKSLTPVICTTIMRMEYYKRVNFEAREASAKAAASGLQKNENPKSLYSNIIIDHKYFTHYLSIVPAKQAEKDGISRAIEYKNAHYASAYLRSKHKANIAGSANHRVKFSIFSDMLWVDDSGTAPKP